MDETRWLQLVQKLEPVARSHPRAYRWRVRALAALGYAFIAGALLVLLALGGLAVLLARRGYGILVLKLLIPIVALLVVFGRSLNVKIDPPEGVPLTRPEAPELFAMIEEVRGIVSSPKVHTLLIDGDLNAGVSQVPTVGGLFRVRNYLVLGFPYLALLSAEELHAVVAHELAHLAGAHGRFGARVYRVRATWEKLLVGLEERKSTWTALARSFFEWYVPYFSAYTLPAARAHEVDADAAAAGVAGNETAGSTLVIGALGNHWLQDSYWPAVFKRMLDEPAPPAAFDPLAQEIWRARGGPADVAAWYKRLLAAEADPTDPHPSLAERLTSIGCDPRRALALARERVGPSALEHYLGAARSRLVAELDHNWKKSVRLEWVEQHRQAENEKPELARLEHASALPLEELVQRALLTEKFRDADAALARNRELLDTEADAYARLTIGRLLLARGDDEGLRWLDQAAERDWQTVLVASLLANSYLGEHGRDEEAEGYWRRFEQQSELLEKAENERAGITLDGLDRLDRPDLPREQFELMRDAVAAESEVAAAYLVRKHTQYLDDESPFYILALVPRSYKRATKSDSTGANLTERLANSASLPAQCLVVTLRENNEVTRKLAQVEGASLLEETKAPLASAKP
jgi:tetratricopeptide (TPR) repeat protein